MRWEKDETIKIKQYMLEDEWVKQEVKSIK